MAKDDIQTVTRRGRGAPPGNTNALKHGFYSRLFRQGDEADLADPGVSIRDDIDMLHVVMRCMFEQAMNDTPDLDTWAKILASLGKTSYHICALMRAEVALKGKKDEVAEALSQALSDVLEELER